MAQQFLPAAGNSRQRCGLDAIRRSILGNIALCLQQQVPCCSIDSDAAMIQSDVHRFDDAVVLSRYLALDPGHRHYAFMVLFLGAAQAHITGTVQCKRTVCPDRTQDQIAVFPAVQIDILAGVGIDNGAIVEDPDTITVYADAALSRS